MFGLEEQGRGTDSKFLTKNPGDSIPGSDAVAKVRGDYETNGYKILGDEISFVDDTGKLRTYDLVAETPDGTKVIGVEVKASETASYNSKQKGFDSRVNNGNSANAKPTGDKAKQAGITKIDGVDVVRCK